jgi:rhamnose utilization protein RhaD (predicted bifunctional aldolase and dehydrogenase)
MTEELKTITDLSHEFGTADYVKGGGGNTSFKNADTLWVKPSGTTLSGLKPETFVAMDRAKLGLLYQLAVPAEKDAREAQVKAAMDAAVKPGQTARPSVEAPLHDALKGAYVVHTHPALVNGMTSSKQGEEACRRLFPDALWVPYVDPGYTLCMEAYRRIGEYRSRFGREPDLLMLGNHGVFVSANTAEDMRGTYGRVMTALRASYEKAGVAMDLAWQPLGAKKAVRTWVERVKEWLGPNAAEVVHSAPFAVAEGPISPDHIVYGKSYAFRGPLSKAGLDAFIARRGYPPRVIATPDAVLGVGATLRQAQLALEFAQDGALVRQLAAAFGGLQILSDSSREFIENWEVESYRARQMA